MTETIRGQISASVDGELSLQEWDMLAKRMALDIALRCTWENYHLISDAIQDSLAPCYKHGFSERVMVELEAEKQLPHKANRRALGLAMAASVALAALGVGGYYEQAGLGHGSATRLASVSASASTKRPGTNWHGAPAPVQQQLNNLLISHTDYISKTHRQPMLPYLHVAADSAPRHTKHLRTATLHTVADEPPN